MDPKKQWSSADIVFPMDVLCGYIHDQGLLETNNQDDWNKLTSDRYGWWSYHDKTGGNLQNFFDNAMIPNMQKRILLLDSDSCVGRFIAYVIKHIKEKYPSATDKSSSSKRSLGELSWG